jgi:hypothetical protein
MIGRAIFWISFVYLLAPPPPDRAAESTARARRDGILVVLDRLDAELKASARQK